MSNITTNAMLGLLVAALGGIMAHAQAPAPAPAFPPTALTPPATGLAGPRIQFATPIADVGKVKSGEPAKYTYYFTNSGTECLEVTDVHPGCGCTTAGDWTKKVAPDGTGVIPVQFNSGNYGAGPFIKMVTVTCNDTNQRIVQLQLKGTIWKPIDVVPQYAVLNLPADQARASTIVRIINYTAEPITISSVECSNRAFSVVLTNIIPGKEFQLTLATAQPLPVGNTSGQITVRTSSTNAPVVNIPIWANVQPPIMVMPNQLFLQPAPLAVKTTQSVTIQNNSTNQLMLSDPAVSVPGVEVQITALQTGRVYSATLSFPQGFEIPQGQQAVFSVKSSHPQLPVIEVPIRQIVRPNLPPHAVMQSTSAPGIFPRPQRIMAHPMPGTPLPPPRRSPAPPPPLPPLPPGAPNQ